MRTPQHPDIHTTEQLAEALGYSPAVLRRWAAAGKIPVLRVGKDLRFSLPKVLEALEDADRRRAAERATVTAEPDLEALPRARTTSSRTRRGAHEPAPRGRRSRGSSSSAS